MNVLGGGLQLCEAHLDIRTHLLQGLNKVGDLGWREAVFEYYSDKFQGFLLEGRGAGRKSSEFVRSVICVSVLKVSLSALHSSRTAA
jgi:hypothetical protein